MALVLCNAATASGFKIQEFFFVETAMDSFQHRSRAVTSTSVNQLRALGLLQPCSNYLPADYLLLSHCIPAGLDAATRTVSASTPSFSFNSLLRTRFFSVDRTSTPTVEPTAPFFSLDRRELAIFFNLAKQSYSNFVNSDC